MSKQFALSRAAAVLILMGGAAVSGVAQTTPTSAKDLDDRATAFIKAVTDDSSAPAFPSPQSGVSQATFGTLDGNIDRFMSVTRYRDMDMESWFGYGGLTRDGINVGYAMNLGSLYLGVYYGGSLVDDLWARITNKGGIDIRRQDTETTISGKTTSAPRIVDGNGDDISGKVSSQNSLSILLGLPKAKNMAFKLSFSEYLGGRYVTEFKPDDNSYETKLLFESSLKPALDWGMQIRTGSVTVYPELGFAVDFHQLSSNLRNSATSTTGTPTTTTTITTTTEDFRSDYTEFSANAGLGINFTPDTATRTELNIGYRIAGRAYSNGDIKGTDYDYTEVATGSAPSSITGRVTNTFTLLNLRNKGDISFLFNTEVSPRMSLGAKLGIGLGVDVNTQSLEIKLNDGTTDFGATAERNVTTFRLNPELNVGISYQVMPTYLTLHGGLGVVLHHYEMTTTENSWTPTSGGGTASSSTVVESSLRMPYTKFALGATLNLSASVTGDIQVMSSGVESDNEKKVDVSILFSVKH